MALPDLTGQNIENTYQRVVQTDGTLFYDGTGSLLDIGGTINTGSFATTGSNTFRGDQTITGSLIVRETGGDEMLNTSTSTLNRLGTTSVDWRNRTLNNSGASVILDWENSQTFDTSTNLSIDWENRVLWDLTGGAESIDYGRRKLYNSTGGVTLDYNTGVLTGTASFAQNAQNAQTASYVNPLNQNVQITGSLSVSGSVIVNNVDIQSTIIAMAIALG